jgi:hypothetical protein
MSPLPKIGELAFNIHQHSYVFTKCVKHLSGERAYQQNTVKKISLKYISSFTENNNFRILVSLQNVNVI